MHNDDFVGQEEGVDTAQEGLGVFGILLTSYNDLRGAWREKSSRSPPAINVFGCITIQPSQSSLIPSFSLRQATKKVELEMRLLYCTLKYAHMQT